MTEPQKEDNQSSEQQIAEYQQLCKEKLQGFLSGIVETKEKAFSEKIEKLTDLSVTGDLNRVTIILKEFKMPDPEPEFNTTFRALFENVPVSVDLKQNEHHFESEPSDSVFIRIQKTTKRLNRSFSKGLIGSLNFFRGIVKKPGIKWDYPIREVPLQNLLMLASMELLESIRQLDVILLRHHAMIYDNIFRWYARPPEAKKQQDSDDLSSVIKQLTAGFNNDLDQFKNATRDQMETIDQHIDDMISKAGTIELRNSRLEDADIEQKLAAITRKYTPVLNKWVQCNELLQDRVETMAQSINLINSIGEREEKVLHTMDAFFSGFRSTPQARLQELLDDALESLTSGGSPSPRELKIKSEEIASSVAEHVRESVLQTLQNAIDESLLNTAINTYAEDLLWLAEQQPQKVVLSEHTNLTEDVPSFEEIRVDWQRVIYIMCADIIASELLSDTIEPERELKTILTAFEEVAQIIETNLKLVDEITHDEDQKPADIAIDGVKRAILKFEEAAAATDMMQQSLLFEVTGKNQAFQSELMGFLSKDDFGNEAWVQTQLKVKESAGDWKVKWTVGWAGFMSRIDLLRRFISRKYGVWAEKVRVFLGNEQTEGLKSERINLATFLHETGQKFRELPFIYRRLFDFQRAIDSNLYVREPHHFEQVKKAFSLWKDGFPSSLAVSGEVGSGKKTLVSFLEEEVLEGDRFHLSFSETIWKENAVILRLCNALELPPAADEAELIGLIKSKRSGSVMIIENLHNCYIRAMSGYPGLHLLLSVIAETRKEVFWVVTCYKYSWNFLQVYMNIADHFSHIISTDQLTTSEIRNLIMKRQKASGYAFRFLPTAETENSRAFKKLLDDDIAQQNLLADKYFDKLSAIAAGNATVAIIYWVRSIVDFSDHEVQLRALNTTGMELIASLEPNILFAISAFLLHGSLSTEELSICLNVSLSETEMIVSGLNTNGLLVEKNGSYALNLLIYRQVVRVLMSKNMLH